MQNASLAARDAVRQLNISRIREVANAGMKRGDVVAFWFGEPDQVTPEFIRQAAVEALDAGETFYTENLGIPALREAIARYVSGLHRPVSLENIAVTNSGMSALMITTQALVGPGDRVVIVTPVWPNLVEIPKILGAQSVSFPLTFTAAGWKLDLDRLLEVLSPDTRAVYINSPNNPTGWTIDTESQKTILEHCRRHGIWLLADDAYERLFFGNDEGLAPSFLRIADSRDRLVSVNTFSKAWQMTGWRLGWMVVPEELASGVATLIEYNTSCVPGFVQRAGATAIEAGEDAVKDFNVRLKHARDFLLQRLMVLPGVEASPPDGAMYAFFRLAQARDSLAFCKQLVDSVGLGLAPGIAFGPEGEGFVRWCFAASEARLAAGIERLREALNSK
ncbi:MAG: pyridoxal phosphate-dependent aminotransferase [Betaproteobacteria bacterium]|nr:MAG: pyridoxal phosphate-dependent aminotransferase [Betaproteobacteria bacterium]